MKELHYFSYGSNMSTRRLGARIRSARPLTVAVLPEHRLFWHKQGRDGSGKCDAAYTGDHTHIVMGVLYEMAADDKPLLDQFEGVGVGYEEISIALLGQAGERLQAFTYQATLIDPTAVPFLWYKEHVLRGACEHGLPDSYISLLEQTPAMDDQDTARHERELLIYR